MIGLQYKYLIFADGVRKYGHFFLSFSCVTSWHPVAALDLENGPKRPDQHFRGALLRERVSKAFPDPFQSPKSGKMKI